jgi:hypothetical protein
MQAPQLGRYPGMGMAAGPHAPHVIPGPPLQSNTTPGPQPGVVPRRDKSLSALSHELIARYGTDGTVIDLDDVQVRARKEYFPRPSRTHAYCRIPEMPPPSKVACMERTSAWVPPCKIPGSAWLSGLVDDLVPAAVVGQACSRASVSPNPTPVHPSM